MEPQNEIDWAIFKLNPDFNMLRKYITLGGSEKEFNRFVKSFKKNGSTVEIHFMTLEQEDAFAEGSISILDKYDLHQHSANLIYLILVLLRSSYIKMTEYRKPAMNNLDTVEQFKHLADYLLKHDKDKLKVTFDILRNSEEGNMSLDNIQRPQIKDKLSLTDTQLTDWLKDILLDSIGTGNYPIQLGYQLYKSTLVCDTDTKRQYLRIDPNAYFEKANDKAIKLDAVLEVCVPILNYLQKETHITKGASEHWSFEQLSVLIDILILIKYYRSTNKHYEIGMSEPTVADKRYLDSTLRNKLNQGKLLKIKAIE